MSKNINSQVDSCSKTIFNKYRGKEATTRMKTKAVYITATLFGVILTLVLWRLNQYYREEKSLQIQEQMNQQMVHLKTSVSTELSQIRKNISLHQYGVKEAQLNWEQLSPYLAIGEVQLNSQLQYQLGSFYSASDSKVAKWNASFVQKGLGANGVVKKNIVAKLFKTKSGDKFVVLLFLDQFVAGAKGVYALAEADVFQKYFDRQRSRKLTHILSTTEGVVVSHSEPDYIASPLQSNPYKKNDSLFLEEELRSSNLKLLTSTSKKQFLSGIQIPQVLFGAILGLGLVFLGGLIYFWDSLVRLTQQIQVQEKEKKFEKIKQDLMVVDKSALVQSEVLASKSEALRDPLKLPKMVVERTELLSSPEIDSQVSEIEEFSVASQIQENQNFTHEIEEVTQKLDLISLEDQEPQSLSDIVTSVSDQLSQFQKNNVEIETSLQSKNLLHVDSKRVQKLIFNLIQNSLEARKNQKPLKIQINTYDLADKSILEIIDNGIGFQQAVLSKIGQPYITTKDKKKHQGLGLTEVQSIVEKYHGRMSIENIPEGGARVKVQFRSNLEKNVEPHNAEGTHSEVKTAESIEDLDLDQLLKLDDLEEVPSVALPKNGAQIEDQFKTQQFKMEKSLQIAEDPQIEFQKKQYSVDQFAVKIRKPERTT